MEGYWLASTMYDANQSVFHYPKQKMLTLDTTETSSVFDFSALLCLWKDWKTRYGH